MVFWKGGGLQSIAPVGKIKLFETHISRLGDSSPREGLWGIHLLVRGFVSGIHLIVVPLEEKYAVDSLWNRNFDWFGICFLVRFLDIWARENSRPCQRYFLHSDLARRIDSRHPEGPWIFCFTSQVDVVICNFRILSPWGLRAHGPQGPWAQGH